MELQDLLAEKDFEELTTAEQQQVLLICTEEEYQAQRQAIVASQALWAAELPTLQPAAPHKALQALQAKRLLLEKNKVVVVPWWLQVARYSLPVWKVAVAALLLLFLTQALPKKVGLANPMIVSTDTVYVERYHTKIEPILQPADTIIKIVYKTIDTVATVVEPTLARVSNSYGGMYTEEILIAREEVNDLWERMANNRGGSLNQDTFLQEMTRQVVANTVSINSTW